MVGAAGAVQSTGRIENWNALASRGALLGAESDDDAHPLTVRPTTATRANRDHTERPYFDTLISLGCQTTTSDVPVPKLVPGPKAACR